MIRKEFCIEEMPNAFGGKGTLVLNHWLSKEEMVPNLKMICTAVLPVGGSAGNHVHHGEAEIYLITKGKGIYYDNGKPIDVKENDILVNYDGDSHEIVNTGDCELAFIAVIVKGTK